MHGNAVPVRRCFSIVWDAPVYAIRPRPNRAGCNREIVLPDYRGPRDLHLHTRHRGHAYHAARLRVSRAMLVALHPTAIGLVNIQW